MARNKKKHVCSCGEEFNHGIGLRKHQRQSGHKGSSVIDDDGPGGDDDAEEAPAPPPPAAAPPPPPPPVREQRPQPVPEPAAPAPPPPRAAAPPPPPPPASPIEDDDDDDDEPDQTVAVSRQTSYSAPPQSQPRPQQQQVDYGEGPSRFAHNRQKLSLVSRGLRVLFHYRARSAGDQLKRSARSGADIFTEAFKIALSLLLIMAIPAGIFWWWWAQRRATPPPVQVPSSFSFDQGALSARSTVLQYLDSLNKQQWPAAYSKLSGSWQAEMSQASFVEAFAGISDIRWAVNDQRLLPSGAAEVNLLMAYQEDGRAKKFQSRFRLTQDGQSWKVDRVELSSPSPR